MRDVIWDTEDRSVVDLRDAGGYMYAIDPTTEPLCVVIAIDDSEPQMWLRGQPPLPVFFDIAANPDNWRLVAHNSEFDRFIYDHVLVPRYGFPPLPLEVHHCSQRVRAGRRLSG